MTIGAAAQLVLLEMCDAALSREVRTLLEFCQEEIVLPWDGGPHQGEHFDTSVQPWTRLLFDEVDRGPWAEIIMTAPSQCGKTLILFCSLVLYVAAELRRNVVIGLPDEEMWSDKWGIDLRPVIEASPGLRELLLPKRGPGSQEGRVKEAVALANGVILKPMTPQGGEASRSGFTASHVCVTELYQFTDDPFHELVARQDATSMFDETGQLQTERRLFGEGTLTTKHELPWLARCSEQHEGGPISTESEIWNPCPACGEWSVWEREHLRGWPGAANAIAAGQASRFYCPRCNQAITEDQRRDSVRRGVLVHRGQTVGRDGVVTGDVPQVPRLFFRVNGFNNLFRQSYDLGLREWEAAQLESGTPEREAAEKYLCTKVWCLPYEPTTFDEVPLSRRAIRTRQSKWPENVLPSDAKWFAVGVDPGRWQIWYFGLVARETGELCCVFADAIDTTISGAGEVSEQHEHVGILNALRVLRDRLQAGLPQDGSAVARPPDQVWIDANYHRSSGAVHQICKEAGTGIAGPWMPVIGRGRSQSRDPSKYTAPRRVDQEVRLIDPGGRFHLGYVRAKRGFRVVLDADAAKMGIQAALQVQPGKPGSLVLWDAPEKRHITVSRHLAAEVFKRYVDPRKGLVEEWVRTGANHLLDCAGYALCALWRLGWSAAGAEDGVTVTRRTDAPRELSAWWAKAAGGGADGGRG